MRLQSIESTQAVLIDLILAHTPSRHAVGLLSIIGVSVNERSIAKRIYSHSKFRTNAIGASATYTNFVALYLA